MVSFSVVVMSQAKVRGDRGHRAGAGVRCRAGCDELHGSIRETKEAPLERESADRTASLEKLELGLP
jgi:hypothetical protein